MGGTDQMDQNVRGKKWYWPLLTWIFDVALQNIWILYNRSRKQKISQLECKREVATVYLKKFNNLPKGSGRQASSLESSDSRVSDNSRFDHLDHLIQQTIENKRRGCARKACNSTVRTMCLKCKVVLCISSFAPYHTC